MNDTQRAKRAFRASLKWRKFLHFMNIRQDGLCFITKRKLRKYAALHHCDLNAEHYQDISNPDNFVYLSHSMHGVVHDLWPYYKDDPTVLDRLKEVLDKMKELNG